VGYIALFVALSGSAYALSLPANIVGNRQLRNRAVTSVKVKDHSLLRRDFRTSELPHTGFALVARMNGILENNSMGGAVLFGSPSGTSTATGHEDEVSMLSPDVRVTASSISVKLLNRTGLSGRRQFGLSVNRSERTLSCIVPPDSYDCTSRTGHFVIPARSEISIRSSNPDDSSSGVTEARVTLGLTP
jgi:hypothetical protein